MMTGWHYCLRARLQPFLEYTPLSVDSVSFNAIGGGRETVNYLQADHGTELWQVASSSAKKHAINAIPA
jgi:hypothetical protein